jgi:hypothetical protein
MKTVAGTNGTSRSCNPLCGFGIGTRAKLLSPVDAPPLGQAATDESGCRLARPLLQAVAIQSVAPSGSAIRGWHLFRSHLFRSWDARRNGHLQLETGEQSGELKMRRRESVRKCTGFDLRGQRRGQCTRNLEPEPWISLSILLLLACAATGCETQAFVTPVNNKNIKIETMNEMLRTVALDSIERETHFFGRPLQIEYWVSIAPRISSGFMEFGGADPLPSSSVPISVSYTCAAETVESARISTVFEAVLGADHGLRTSTFLFQWDGKKWRSQGQLALDELQKTDPSAAEPVRRIMANGGK